MIVGQVVKYQELFIAQVFIGLHTSTCISPNQVTCP